MTEEEKILIAACVKGEKAAWDAFVHQYSNLIYHTIKTTFSLHHTDPSSDSVAELVQEVFLSLISTQRIARDLYGELLSPVASVMKGKDLIVVPQDVLHYLPFHALYSPEGKYLVEGHTISYLSSASLLQFVVGKRRQSSE
jgi:CHAT domain-containing protein